MRRIAVALAIFLMMATGCTLGDTSSQDKETDRQQSVYDRLVAEQPAKKSSYSATRATINFWIDTWGQEPGKLSYVYLLASNGQMIGYYILEGLPVSYCASLTPTQELQGSSSSRVAMPRPAMDGVYYSGASCAAYYGKDAVSGTYIEFTIGDGISALIYEAPLPRQDVEPLSTATVEDVEDIEGADR